MSFQVDIGSSLFLHKVDVGKYIVIDPEICHGQMTFRGTRVPVDTVLTFLARGYSVNVLLHSWPELSRSAIEEAVSLASQSLQARYAPYVTAAVAASQPHTRYQREPDYS